MGCICYEMCMTCLNMCCKACRDLGLRTSTEMESGMNSRNPLLEDVTRTFVAFNHSGRPAS